MGRPPKDKDAEPSGRLNVILSPVFRKALDDLAKSRESNATAVLKDAIAFLSHAENCMQAGLFPIAINPKTGEAVDLPVPGAVGAWPIAHRIKLKDDPSSSSNGGGGPAPAA